MTLEELTKKYIEEIGEEIGEDDLDLVREELGRASAAGSWGEAAWVLREWGDPLTWSAYAQGIAPPTGRQRIWEVYCKIMEMPFAEAEVLFRLLLGAELSPPGGMPQ